MKDLETELLEKQKQERELKEKRDEESRFFYALQRVKDTEDGRIVIDGILKMCPIDDEVFCGSDPFNTAYLCGKRAVGLQLRSFLNKK